MLQRQIMFKQLEELQRQKKLQELNDSRQQNVLNQQSLLQNKQASGAQYAPLINGTPVRDPSQMFMFGNTNLVHGFQNGSPYSQAQSQILQSMSLPSQPVDGLNFNRFSHFQGPTREPTSEQANNQFNASYQTGIDQEQDIINPSQEFSSLDPLEQKFLFTDDDNVGGFGSMFEDNDNTQSFPSVQSGSWSALMQSALEETSSTDTGVQEEWSGLSFQNPEPSNDNNQPSNIIENVKNPSLWQNNILQNAPSLNSRPLHMHQGSSGEFEKGFLPDNQRQSASDVTTFNVDRSADLNSQTSRHMLELLHKVNKFKEYNKQGTQSAYTDSLPINETPKTETTDTLTPSSNSSTPQYFGLRLGPPSQRPPMTYFDLSQISQQAGEDGQSQRSSLFEANSTRQSNTWVDIHIPSQQNLSGMGLQKAPSGSPSTSDVANSRVELETASEAPKESDKLLETASGHVLNSQGFDYAKGQESFSGRAIKNENVDSGIKAPLLTSTSQLSSVYDNYKTVLGSQLHKNSSFVQMNLASTSQYGTSSLAVNQDLLLSQSKKRKFPMYEVLPWHIEATKGSSRPHNTSIAELEWARATKRVPEKLKEEAEALSDSSWKFHSKKRIILTTQLMQVLFRPAPASILSDDANTCYNTISYFAARLALGDACSLANYSRTPSDTSDSLSEKGTISKGSGDQNLSKIVENFIDRAKKLEDELLRLENGGSVVEIRMESQDLERFSVINRFAKFHTRPQMVAPDPSSSGAPKLHPQRYVTASPMPKIVPQGHNCLPL